MIRLKTLLLAGAAVAVIGAPPMPRRPRPNRPRSRPPPTRPPIPRGRRPHHGRGDRGHHRSHRHPHLHRFHQLQPGQRPAGDHRQPRRRPAQHPVGGCGPPGRRLPARRRQCHHSGGRPPLRHPVRPRPGPGPAAASGGPVRPHRGHDQPVGRLQPRGLRRGHQPDHPAHRPARRGPVHRLGAPQCGRRRPLERRAQRLAAAGPPDPVGRSQLPRRPERTSPSCAPASNWIPSPAPWSPPPPPTRPWRWTRAAPSAASPPNTA